MATMSVQEVVLILRNRHATPALLRRIDRDRRLTLHDAVRRGLVLHPNTPPSLARARVPQLNWRELAEVAAAAEVNPVVRRSAEKYLEMRLQVMTLGERIALARRAVRGTIGALIGLPDAPVVAALLGNPRMVEADALRLASGPLTPPATLGVLAEHQRFCLRREVRLALARNPRTPVASALGVVHHLDARDLQRLGEDDKVPRIVRIGAERRLRTLRGSPPPSHGHA